MAAHGDRIPWRRVAMAAAGVGLLAPVAGCGDPDAVESPAAASAPSNSAEPAPTATTVTTTTVAATTTVSDVTPMTTTTTTTTVAPATTVLITTPPHPPPSTNETTAPEATVPPTPVGDGTWVLPEPPPSFLPVLAVDRWGRREIYYQTESDRRDLYNAPITVTVTFDDQSFIRDGGGLAHGFAVDVNGADAYRYEMWSDGEHYGTAVHWVDDQDRWVILEWRSIPVPGDEIVDLARSMTEIDETAWDDVLSELGPDVVIGD